MSRHADTRTLDLFPPAPSVARDRYGIPRGVAAMWARAQSQECKDAILDAAAAKPGVWLGWHDFREVRAKYQIGACMGHILSSLVRAGKLQERTVYLGKGIGAEHPGSPNYQGYRTEWRALEVTL